MAAAVSMASNPDGQPAFTVVGVDLPTPDGQGRVNAINAGRFPFQTSDADLLEAIRTGHERGNLTATTDPKVYESADIVVVDIHLDVDTAGARTDFSGFRKAIATLAAHVRPGTLVVIETTVPPGTCARVVAPELAAGLEARGLSPDSVLLAHSYERVMPGPHYLSSIISYPRVYSGHTPAAAEACAHFLERVIDIEKYPLTRLSSTTASETAKVLENTFRAVTISLMDEWGRFAERTGTDMFEIANAIRMRPSHVNIRQPGIGVGGYCLTKDPLFGVVAARQLFDDEDLDFPVSRLAVTINQNMPLHVLGLLETHLGDLAGRRILLLGVAYRSEVDDTRYSPSETLLRAVTARGAEVVCHDPLVRYWPELSLTLPTALPSPQGFDAIVLAVDHQFYKLLDWVDWLKGVHPLIVDGNCVLNATARAGLANAGHRVVSVGRGN